MYGNPEKQPVSAIPVDHDIPLPDDIDREHSRAGAGGRPCIYPWKEMQIGDSFFVGSMQFHGHSAAGKRLGMTFVKRRWSYGSRIWRIA